MKEIIYFLKNLKSPVREKEWQKIEQMLDKKEENVGNKPFLGGINWVWPAVAATLLLLVGFGTMFLWNFETNFGNFALMNQQEQMEVELDADEYNHLTHREFLVGKARTQAKPAVVTPSSDGSNVVPYRTTLPNGENWLVYLSVMHMEENCTANLAYINDKALGVNLVPRNKECSEFQSENEAFQLQMTSSGQTDAMTLVLQDLPYRGSSTNGKLSLELKAVY